MHRECRERFPRHWLQMNPLVSDPSMHHGTCATHVPWCMSGSLIRDGGENFRDIRCACTTRNLMYLVRGPCHSPNPSYSRKHNKPFMTRLICNMCTWHHLDILRSQIKQLHKIIDNYIINPVGYTAIQKLGQIVGRHVPAKVCERYIVENGYCVIVYKVEWISMVGITGVQQATISSVWWGLCVCIDILLYIDKGVQVLSAGFQ